MPTSNEIAVRVPIPRELATLSEQAERSLKLAREFRIATSDDYELAARELRLCKQNADSLDSMRKSLTKPIDESKNTIMGWFKPALALLSEAEQTYKRVMLAFTDEQERRRRAEQAKLDEMARKARERFESEAEAAAKKGRVEKAEELHSRAALTAPAVSAASAPKVAGVSFKTLWHAELIDIIALCRAVADGSVPPIAVEANMTFLNQQARSLESHFNVPGCKAVSEKVLASSKRA